VGGGGGSLGLRSHRPRHAGWRAPGFSDTKSLGSVGIWPEEVHRVQSSRRRPYPPEFKREAVELYRCSGNSLQVVVGELDVAVESLRSWNKRHEIDLGPREGLTSAEREELRELRRQLLRERDLLKRAAGFFARETEIR
jgi:transposase